MYKINKCVLICATPLNYLKALEPEHGKAIFVDGRVHYLLIFCNKG